MDAPPPPRKEQWEEKNDGGKTNPLLLTCELQTEDPTPEHLPGRPRSYWGGGRLSAQLPLSRPNRTDARWTVQKRTRPTFERLSSQFLCLHNCPSLLFARTSRFLDLEICKRYVLCGFRELVSLTKSSCSPLPLPHIFCLKKYPRIAFN